MAKSKEIRRAVAAGTSRMSGAERATFDSVMAKRGRLRKAVDDKYQSEIRGNDRTVIESRLFRSMANDIHPIPDIQNADRRAATKYNLALFCKTYFPLKFELEWSQDHLDLIATIQRAVLEGGGLFANAMPRGSGKSTIAECAGLWALFHGHKRYVVLIAATTGHAREMFRSMQTEIEVNDLLLADFPEIVYPIQQLRGSYFRAKFQHLRGEPTRVTLTSDFLMFPTVTGSDASGSVIQCTSITGRIRGMKQTTPEGESVRPDLVIVDDPQTDRSAKSAQMTAQREKIVSGTILGLAGPAKSITAIMPCTVIEQNDLAERFLDRGKRPEWQGQRTQMLRQFPKRMDLWGQYNDIRAESYRKGNGGKESTEFYRQNREAMDDGAEVSWADRFDPRLQISALQFAMDMYLNNPVTFASEYQNQPLAPANADGSPRLNLVSADLVVRTTTLQRGYAPWNTLFTTAGIDIQGKVLYYVVVAWTEDFGGAVVDFGTFPRQSLDYFLANDPPVTLSREWPDLALPPQCFAALERLADGPLGMTYTRDTHEVYGRENPNDCVLDRALIDANWNQVTDSVYAFCKPKLPTFLPSHGKGIGAAMLPMELWAKRQGEVKGQNWIQKYMTLATNRGRHIIYDTNYWKSVVATRLAVPKGAFNALLLPNLPIPRLQLFADHLCSETPIQTKGRGREVDEWKQKPGTENHWFDCLVQAAVAASVSGLVPHDAADTPIVVESKPSLPERPHCPVPVPVPKAERKKVPLGKGRVKEL